MIFEENFALQAINSLMSASVWYITVGAQKFVLLIKFYFSQFIKKIPYQSWTISFNRNASGKN